MIGIAIGLVALWMAMLVVFWLFRPKDVPLRELLGVVPDLVRMLRTIVRDPSSPMRRSLVLVGLLVWNS